jgi:hypothetical protein
VLSNEEVEEEEEVSGPSRWGKTLENRTLRRIFWTQEKMETNENRTSIFYS